MTKPKPPLRGEAAWQAARAKMAAKNEAARCQAVVDRAEHEARAVARRREIEAMDAQRPS